ncbi:hypothetical protein DXT99_10165 [Pontibacter diazotrophicus]|uniref:Lipoprotein n=1 Tax=Pontibacter diazotrophicus TaxID=1400979 RepID=A0A3D8LDD8_9BACT|nr:hypothetical protein [Pontibacter diazotrophicus]RDV15410.1 hypothetical protein DXT99_10165 [Pontibacter diazotrophicus]
MKNFSLIVILTMFTLSCSGPEKLESDKSLENSIQQNVSSGQETLDFNELTQFKWDSLIILTPYSNPESLADKFDVNFSSIEHAGIQSRDDINLIIFFDEGEPIRMVEYPRYPGDFANNEIRFVRRNEAIYNIVVTDQLSTGGDKWINVIKK